jgi:polyisoprenoid-binding protein YceI
MARWNFDETHSGVDFVVRHMMVSKVRGNFTGLKGSLEFDEEHPENSEIVARIDVSTINTRNTDRDNHLRSADFFDVENHPEMIFKSTSIKVNGEKQGQVTGNLTIRGVTKPVTFDVEYFGQLDSPFGDRRTGFSGEIKIDREQFGLTWNQALETGGWLVGKEITIHVELEAILATAAETA